MTAVTAVTTPGETSALCASVGVSRASYYRRRVADRHAGERRPRPAPPRSLVPAERQAVLDVLHSERFVDQSPAEVHATLLEEQTYLCSTRTMYRILADSGEVRERRDQARHPAYAKPELVATAPNQIWSWDIERHEALLNLAVVKGHCLWLVAACQKKLRAAEAGERR